MDGEFVAIPGNGDNDVKAGVVNESVELSRELLTPLMPIVSSLYSRIDQADRCCGVLDDNYKRYTLYMYTVPMASRSN